jgi:hypothetical protein
MKDLCIPVPNFGPDEVAELQLTIGQKKIQFSFRVVSFPWNSPNDLQKQGKVQDSFEKIARLRSAIESYDKEWEIIQIYTPPEGAEFIQVLFRKRYKN